jgi:hypothetical protein
LTALIRASTIRDGGTPRNLIPISEAIETFAFAAVALIHTRKK